MTSRPGGVAGGGCANATDDLDFDANEDED